MDASADASGSISTPRPRPHAAWTSAIGRPVARAADWTQRAERDQLLVLDHENGPLGEVGDDLRVRGAPRAAAHEEETFARVDTRGNERVESVEQPAHHPFVRGARDIVARRVGTQPGEEPGRVRAVGRPLAVEVRQQGGATRTRRRGERERVEGRQVHAEPARHRVGDLRRVERAHEREDSGRWRRRSPRPHPRRRGSGCRSPRTPCPTCRARSRRHRDGARAPARPPCCRRCRARASGGSTGGTSAAQSRSASTISSRSRR